MRQISIVTALFNRLDLTRACIESVTRTLQGWDFEWIFIDDGSTDGTRDFLHTLSGDGRFRVICNDAPAGFAANNNRGARLATAPLLCLLNNDTVVLPGWLEPMARLARLLPDVACVGNVQREPVSGLIDHCGAYFDRQGRPRHAGKDRPAPPREDYLEWPAITAACWVIRREVFLSLGGFDETFRNGFEDTDFCLRAGVRGYRHFVANRSVIYHHISASPGRKQSELDNRQKFLATWLPRLETDLRGRRWLADQHEDGRRYLEKHRRQPWYFNVWRLARALEKVWSPWPVSRQLDLLPRLLFRAQDFLRARRENAAPPAPAPRAEAPVFLVVGDTVRTADRSSIPTLVRSLAAACGRIGAPVWPVVWNPATGSLHLLPAEWSVGLDAEALRAGVPWRGPSAAALCDPAVADPEEDYPDTPALHDLPRAATRPGEGWVLLPEVYDAAEATQLSASAHRRGWRVAVIFHGALPAVEPRFFPPVAPTEIDGRLRAVGDADLVLPVSGQAAADWRKLAAARQLPEPPLTVCTPGADTFTRTRVTASHRREASDPIKVLCVSTVEPRKNHRALLAAFEQVFAARPEPALELCLLGEARFPHLDDVPGAVREFAARHPGRVTWLARVEYSALRGLYENCDFTVFPSVLEGAALPILESLWFGRPCICANFGATAEAAAGGGCLTVDVRDPQALADAILALAGSLDRLGALAAEAAARPFKSWEDYAREVLAGMGMRG